MRLTMQRSDNLTEFYGARLGMTASDLRRSFSLPGDFRVHSDGDASGELAVEWAPSASETPASPVMSARFEFHQGLLVAIRADVIDAEQAEMARTQPFVANAAAVLHRQAEATSPDSTSRVRITLLARDCPTHAEEVRQLTGL